MMGERRVLSMSDYIFNLVILEQSMRCVCSLDVGKR